MAADGLLFGVFALFLARALAALIYQHKKYVARPTKEEYKKLFSDRLSAEKIARPKRDVAFWILRLLGLGYLAYLGILVLGLLGANAWPGSVAHLISITYANPALGINTYCKIILMAMLCFIGCYNKSLRFYSCIGLLTGHLVSTVYSLFFYFYKPLQATEAPFLLVSGVADGIFSLLFVYIIIKYKKDATVFKRDRDFPINFSVPMTLTGYLYKGLAAGLFIFTIAIVFIRVFVKSETGPGVIFGYPDPLISNTATLYATLGAISVLLISREKLRQYFFNTLAFPLLLGGIVSLLWIIMGDMNGGVWFHTRGCPIGGICQPAKVDWYFSLYAIVSISVVLLLVSVRRMYYKVDYAVNTLTPSSAIDVIALTKALYKGDEKTFATVLQYIDQYAGGITGRKRGLLNLPFGLFENILGLLFGLRPSFSSMEREEQRYYLRKYFFRNEVERNEAFIPAVAEAGYQVGMSLNSMVTFAYYSYPNARNEIGYVPFDARDRTQGDFAAYPPPHTDIAPLPKDHTDAANFKPVNNGSMGRLVAPRVTTPVKEDLVPDEVDYIIIGSGAGGAVSAYRLACELKEPSRILVVERGNRYQPLQDFSDREIDMMKKVYKEGGLQQTKQYGMTIMQGECVGGSTVVNNAVCFKMPDNIKKLWTGEFGLDLRGLDDEYDQIATELSIQELGTKGVNHIVQAKFKAAVDQYNAVCSPNERLILDNPVRANHLGNDGDGNWNLGNKRMRKRSMLETYIPWSEARGVKFISGMTAVRFLSSQKNKADGVILRAANGDLKRVAVKKAVIVAGGTIASSHFLMRSGIQNENTGKNLSCNFAFPVTLDFKDELKAYDGDQITVAALDPQNRSAFETYFNPPASFSLSSVPFFFGRRESIMARYKYLVNFGCLLGSEPNGVIQKKAGLLDGQAFTWSLGEKDIINIKYALTTLIKLGKLAGANRAILPTKPGLEIDLANEDDITSFIQNFTAFPLRMTDLFMGTAHPQGGNLMASGVSRHKEQRVVDEDYRLVGYENVFVADASLFPTSLTVNPQWTIMAMSSLAAKNVLKYFPA